MAVFKQLPALLLGLAISPLATACGINFPLQLFADPDATQRDLPAYFFDTSGDYPAPPNYTFFRYALQDYLTSLARSQQAADNLALLLKPDRPAELPVEDDQQEKRDSAELLLIGADAHAIVQEMRSGSANAKKIASLPAVVRLYTDGALQFNGKHPDLKKARERFRAASRETVDGPLQEYQLWAHYMLARSASDAATIENEMVTVRHMIEKEGVADHLDLLPTLPGEEAHLLWLSRTDLPSALHIYTLQAANGDISSWDSIRLVSEAVKNSLGSEDAGERKKAVAWLQDKDLRTVVLAYLYTMPFLHGSQSPENQRAIETLSTVFDQLPLQQDTGVSRLAAVAWQQGRYDLAERWAARSDDALGWWVRGKLAWRSADAKATRAAYDTAIARLQAPAAAARSQDLNCRVQAERGLLAFQDHQYLQAARYLKAGGLDAGYYWWDIAFLAERVLTLDELGQLLAELQAGASNHPSAHRYEGDDSSPTTLQIMQTLYGRRLMRAGKLAEAEVAFRADPALHGLVLQYQQTLAQAQAPHSSAKTRAQQWFELARLIRAHGMELFGYTLGPDGEDMNGGFELPEPSPSEQAIAPERIAATAPLHNHRFHYRGLAVDAIEQAAALLPPRSQAYAATLCQGTAWLINLDPERAHGLYRQYRKNGTRMPWAKNFGQDCPEPVF